jgi:hypothetical protein
MPRIKLWDTPNFAHDNSTDQRFHASLVHRSNDWQGERAAAVRAARGPI